MTQSTLALHAPKDVEEPLPAASPLNWRWQRVAVLLALALIGVAWLTPMIIARTSLRHRIIDIVLPAYPAEATVGGASLSWFAPVTLREVSFLDSAEKELLRITEIRSSKSLLRLILDSDRDLGNFTFTQPQLTVRFRREGSNLEDVLPPLLEGPASTVGVSCEIHDGLAKWIDPNGHQIAGGFDKLNATFVRPEGSAEANRFDLSGQLSDGEHFGSVALSQRTASTAAATPEYSLRATNLPLAPLQVVADRFGLVNDASGTLNADLLFSFSPAESESWWIDGKIDATRLRFTIPESIGEAPLLADHAALSGRATNRKGLLHFEKIRFTSDIGSINAEAKLSVAALASSTWSDWFATALSQEMTVGGRIDLAELTPLLPASAQLQRPIRSGQVAFEIQTAGAPHGEQATATLRFDDIVAGEGDQQVTWKEPFAAKVAVINGGDGFVVERLEVVSDFLHLTGSASVGEGEIQFDVDLDRLRGHVAKFIDLANVAMTGKADGRLSLRRTAPDSTVRAQLDAELRDMEWKYAGRHWTERRLAIAAEADLLLAGTSIDRLNSGRVTIDSAEGDQFTATLNGPMDLADLASWSIVTKINGDIERWLTRLKTSHLIPSIEWSARGDLNGSCVVTRHQQTTELTKLDAKFDRLQLRLADRTFEEPFLHLTGDAVLNHESNRCFVTKSRLDSETAIVEMSNLDIPLLADGAASGHLRFRGGIGRLSRYLLPARPTFWVSGVVAGELSLGSQERATSAEGSVSFEKPTVSLPVVLQGGNVAWQPVWSDSRVNLALKGRYRHDAQSFGLEALRIESTGATVDVVGGVERLGTIAAADLRGQFTYDIEALLGQLPNILPNGLTLQGNRSDRFTVRGPLLSPLGIDPALSASTSIGWDKADLWGLAIGPAQLPISLERTVLGLGPLQASVGGGHIRTSASIALNDRLTMSFPSGRVAENISVTPEICRKWLRYAVPALAETTDIHGIASADLSACRIPLSEPASTDAQGSLVISKLDATPGPFAQSILDSVAQIQQIAGNDPTRGSDLRLFAPEQQIQLRIERGRVYHDRFAVRLGDQDGPLIATSGSVGFDESLDLTVEIPLDAKWFREERIAKALGGQLLRVPVRGTLSNPVPDQRAFQDLARRAASGAVQNAINQQLDKQIRDPLRKLLDR